MDVEIFVPARSNIMMNVYATNRTLQWALFCKLWVTSFSDLSISLSCHTTQWFNKYLFFGMLYGLNFRLGVVESNGQKITLLHYRLSTGSFEQRQTTSEK